MVSVSKTSATIDVGKRIFRVGARGSARVRVEADGSRSRPRPVALDELEGLWPRATVPAESQNPTPIPIGPIRPGGRTDVAVRASASSLFPLESGDPVTRVSLRAQLRSEPFGDTPFGVDADVEASRWIGRGLQRDLGASSRPLLEVQELRLRYGDRDDPIVGLGRLRYASSAVGLLDGARTAGDVGNATIFAFGGVVPETLDGRPSTELARFGAGVAYRDAESSWRPDAEVSAYGSTFEGALDERRAAGYLRLAPGPVQLGGRAELSGYSPNNPWGAERVELTTAGVDVGAHDERYQIQLSVDAVGAERSRWLASLLPRSWLCSTEPQRPGQAEPCDGSRDMRYYGLATAGADFEHLALRLGGTSIASDGLSIDEGGGFADLHLLRILAQVDLEAGTLVSRTDFIDTYAFRVGASSPIAWGLDASAYYRPAILSYRAATEDYFEHGSGLELFYAPVPEWGVRAASEATLGQDVSMLGLFLTAAWRPRF